MDNMKTALSFWDLLFILTMNGVAVAAYRHVIFMHGLLAGEKEVIHFKEYLNKYHPGTNVTFIDDFKYLDSFQPLWNQVQKIRIRMHDIMLEHPEGVHLVCFSQGGLICRGVIETLPMHNVINFISLGSPQAGQFGTTEYLAQILPPSTTKYLYKLFYTEQGQKEFSIANYWNDPIQQNLYFNYSDFLAVINNQSTGNRSQSFSPEFKTNFIKLKNLILVGGADDGVITPWQSSQFESFDENEKVIKMTKQQFYKEDWFGLRTLDERSSLHLCSLDGIHHTHWHRNLTVFLKCIEPWLD